jgi:hypothetical protein
VCEIFVVFIVKEWLRSFNYEFSGFLNGSRSHITVKIVGCVAFREVFLDHSWTCFVVVCSSPHLTATSGSKVKRLHCHTIYLHKISTSFQSAHEFLPSFWFCLSEFPTFTFFL